MAISHPFPNLNLYEKILTPQASICLEWLPRRESVLEIGCSAGYFTNKLRQKAGRAFGVDINKELVNLAQQIYPAVKFMSHEPNILPFPEESFDTVVALEVIEHTDNEKEFIDEVYRVLAPGGLLILSTPHKGLFEWLDPFNLKQKTLRIMPTALLRLAQKTQRINNTQFTDNLQYHKHYSLEELKQILGERFRIIRVSRSGLLLFPICSALLSIVTRLTGALWPKLLLQSLMKIEGRIPFGRFSYNITLMAVKVPSPDRAR